MINTSRLVSSAEKESAGNLLGTGGGGGGAVALGCHSETALASTEAF